MTNTKKKDQKVQTSDKPKSFVKAPTKDQQTELDKLPSISAKIRYLDKENFTRSDIAKVMGKRYQHVRNVLETPLKRKPTNKA